ncbi:MAG: YibE/F family protein [Candidatus Falkowbacteria bacterium]
MKLLKKLLLIILFFGLSVSSVRAEATSAEVLDKPKTAEAQVLKVLDQKESFRENGSKLVQQNLELGILTGPLKGQTETYTGISGIDVVSSNVYHVNDKVLVSYNRDETGQYVFYVTDYVRTTSLLWLTLFFIAVVLLIGGRTGVMALVSLTISFFVIIKVLVPLVFAGYDPLVVGILVSFLILFALIYLTEGWNKKSHISVLSIALSLIMTASLALLFGYLSRLSGSSNEEVVFLIDAIKIPINFHNLLLAAIIIGTLGVLDDVVVGQVESVEQIRSANPNLNNVQVFAMAMNIGRAHLGAIINTLFLAYVSAALPLILLFSIHQEPFLTVSQVINNEDIATEIVRTLVGVISLCLSAPIATFLAVKYLKTKTSK